MDHAILGIIIDLSYERASKLNHQGMRLFRDLYSQESSRFLSWPEAQAKFSLREDKAGLYNNMITLVSSDWRTMLLNTYRFAANDYINMFTQELDNMPSCIIQASNFFHSELGSGRQTISVQPTLKCSR